MHQDDKMALRSLKSCIPVAAVIAYGLYALHHKSWALCYTTGAFLSLFSLFSLTVVVPMLVRPGSSPAVKWVLGLTLFMKLPIYMFALYLMTQLAASGALAAVFGIALAPMVITFRTVAGMFHRPKVNLYRIDEDRIKKSRAEVVETGAVKTSAACRAPQGALPAEGG